MSTTAYIKNRVHGQLNNFLAGMILIPLSGIGVHKIWMASTWYLGIIVALVGVAAFSRLYWAASVAVADDRLEDI